MAVRRGLEAAEVHPERCTRSLLLLSTGGALLLWLSACVGAPLKLRKDYPIQGKCGAVHCILKQLFPICSGTRGFEIVLALSLAILVK